MDEPFGREIWYLNRHLVVLRPRRPFIDWVRDHDPGDPLPDDEVAQAREAFLMPPFDLLEDSWAWIEENATLLFEMALDGWYTDPEMWPRRRDFDGLREWFDVEVIDVLWDMVDAPLSSDPDIERDEGLWGDALGSGGAGEEWH